jgi:hypothetical protein
MCLNDRLFFQTRCLCVEGNILLRVSLFCADPPPPRSCGIVNRLFHCSAAPFFVRTSFDPQDLKRHVGAQRNLIIRAKDGKTTEVGQTWEVPQLECLDFECTRV